MKIRFTFRADVVIEGDNREEIYKKYSDTKLFKEGLDTQFLETVQIVDVTDGGYEDLSDDIHG